MTARTATTSTVTDRDDREFGLTRLLERKSLIQASASDYVKTHCCFCGSNAAQLKVKDNLVVGVEPYEFPFNKGMMCPKGISATCSSHIRSAARH